MWGRSRRPSAEHEGFGLQQPEAGLRLNQDEQALPVALALFHVGGYQLQ